MLLTEAQAKTKWCPFITFCQNEGDPHPPLYRNANCAGSECAAWRWNRDPAYTTSAVQGAGAAAPQRLGFCGVAGRPAAQ